MNRYKVTLPEGGPIMIEAEGYDVRNGHLALYVNNPPPFNPTLPGVKKDIYTFAPGEWRRVSMEVGG